MAIAGTLPVLRIDLNALRGERVRTRRDFAEMGAQIPSLAPGDSVIAVEADGDRFLATVEWVDSYRVGLRLNLASQMPAPVIHVETLGTV